MNVPGTAWIAAIVAISGWVQSTFDEWWVTGLVVVLGAIAKLIELYWPAPESNINERLMEARHPPSKTRRFFLG